jgi:hypothetical protein
MKSCSISSRLGVYSRVDTGEMFSRPVPGVAPKRTR